MSTMPTPSRGGSTSSVSTWLAPFERTPRRMVRDAGRPRRQPDPDHRAVTRVLGDPSAAGRRTPRGGVLGRVTGGDSPASTGSCSGTTVLLREARAGAGRGTRGRAALRVRRRVLRACSSRPGSRRVRTPRWDGRSTTSTPWSSELRERGVVFEDYDLPGLKTVDGIADDRRQLPVARRRASVARGSTTARETCSPSASPSATPGRGAPESNRQRGNSRYDAKRRSGQPDQSAAVDANEVGGDLIDRLGRRFARGRGSGGSMRPGHSALVVCCGDPRSTALTVAALWRRSRRGR